jgi:small redox-active disulfide protein 2
VEIKVLGKGCAKCNQLEKDVLSIVAGMNLAADVERVRNIREIMAYGVMATPALVVNGKVKVSGRLPWPDEIRRWIAEEL